MRRGEEQAASWRAVESWKFEYQAWHWPNSHLNISLVVVFQHANYSCEKILRLKPSLVSSALFCPFQLDLLVGVWYGYKYKDFFPSPFVTEAWLLWRGFNDLNVPVLRRQRLPFNRTKQTKIKSCAGGERSAASAGEAQLDTGGGTPGRRVWMIFGFGEFFGSSSSSMSLSQTCTTTLGVDSVPACSSYFSPGSKEKQSCQKMAIWAASQPVALLDCRILHTWVGSWVCAAPKYTRAPARLDSVSCHNTS